MNASSRRWSTCLSARAVVSLALLVLSCWLARPPEALACGACVAPFVPPETPVKGPSVYVLQSAERVFVGFDPDAHTTTVWVDVRFDGSAKDFGWVLPLPKVPKVSLGSSWVLDRLDRVLAPRFALVQGADENCGGTPVANAPSGTSNGAAQVGYSAVSAPSGSAAIVTQATIGPYAYSVLQADDGAADPAAALDAWLGSNGFALPEGATPIVADYVAKGDVFLVVKLTPGADANAIQPIALQMTDADPCVPLRLTALSATSYMTVSVTLAGPGRAIPKSYLDVELDSARLDWFASANNYASVLAAATEEAGGHAFVTEAAKKSKGVRDATKLELLASALEPWTNGGLTNKTLSGVVNLITNAFSALGEPIPHELLVAIAAYGPAAGKVDPDTFYAAHPPCMAPGVPFGFVVHGTCVTGRDAYGVATIREMADLSVYSVDAAFGAFLQQRFVAPANQAAAMLAASSRVTRMTTRMTPSQMTKDPTFGFNPDLPYVPNLHIAQTHLVCKGGAYPPAGARLVLDGLGSWVFGDDASGKPRSNASDPRFASAPAALRVALVDETGEPRVLDPTDIPIVDAAITDATLGAPSLPPGLTLKPAPAPWAPPASDANQAPHPPGPDVVSGGCTASRAHAGDAATAWAMLATLSALIAASRARRS